jgi:hypothetical protein
MTGEHHRIVSVHSSHLDKQLLQVRVVPQAAEDLPARFLVHPLIRLQFHGVAEAFGKKAAGRDKHDPTQPAVSMRASWSRAGAGRLRHIGNRLNEAFHRERSHASASYCESRRKHPSRPTAGGLLGAMWSSPAPSDNDQLPDRLKNPPSHLSCALEPIINPAMINES